MKITEYPGIGKLTEDNVLLIDGDNGTKKIFVGDAIMEMLHLTSAELHRMIFRGKNLGSVLTAEQKTARRTLSVRNAECRLTAEDMVLMLPLRGCR